MAQIAPALGGNAAGDQRGHCDELVARSAAYAVLALAMLLSPLTSLLRAGRWWPDRILGALFLLLLPLRRASGQLAAPASGPHTSAVISMAQSAVLVHFVLLPILANVGFIQMRHRRRTQHMSYLALHDQLTGLGNAKGSRTSVRARCRGPGVSIHRCRCR